MADDMRRTAVSRSGRGLTDDEIARLLAREGDEMIVDPSSSSSSSSSSRPAIDADDRVHPALRLLQPTTVNVDYASGINLSVKGDIDSFLISCRSPRPFVCEAWCQIYMRPNVPLAVKNFKFTRYMTCRHKFDLRREPNYEAYREKDVCHGEWFEFTLGVVDGRELNVIFQMDLTSPFFARLPIRSTSETDGRSAAVSAAFIKTIVRPAVSRLDADSESARAGTAFVRYDVSRTCTIVRADYDQFARRVADEMLTTDLSHTCGMNRVRFYTFRHGMRLEKDRAESYIKRVVDVNHDHVDVIQIHRADSLSFDEDEDSNDPIVVKLDGNGDDCVQAVFRDSVNLGTGRTERYRTGFLFDYGYYARHSSPPYADHIVTYAQAYNSAAKMARSFDVGLVAAYVICRGYDSRERLERRRADETRQYITDVDAYCRNFVQQRHCLRSEEVLTFDNLRLNDDESMSAAMTRYRVFDQDQTCIVTTEMLRRGALFRLNHWSKHVDDSIGNDLRFLRNVVVKKVRSLDDFALVPTIVVKQAIRALVRVSYFAHGYSHQYNHELMRHVFANVTEHGSSDDGIVRLRPLTDETDEYLYPLYSAQIPFTEMQIVRHLWTVNVAISDLYDDDDDDDDVVVRYILCCYASWAYEKMLPDTLQADVIELARATYLDHCGAFSLQRFVRQFRKHPTNRYSQLVAGYSSANDVARAIAREPRTAFARTVAASVRRLDDDTVATLTEFVRANCHVFPLRLVKPTAKSHWCVVSDSALTVRQVRETLQLAYRAKRRGATFKVPPIRRRATAPLTPPRPSTSGVAARVAFPTPPATTSPRPSTSGVATRVALPTPPATASPPPRPSTSALSTPPPTASHRDARLLRERQLSPSATWRVVLTPAPAASTRHVSPPDLTELKKSIYEQIFDSDESSSPSSSPRVQPRIRCEGAPVGVGTRQSSRLLRKKSVPTRSSATSRTDDAFRWTVDHDDAIVGFVLKHRKTTTYSLSKLIRSRAELFGSGVTSRDIRARMQRIAQGLVDPTYARDNETQLGEFRAIVSNAQT